MHLQIPQTQIGDRSSLTLGILGTEWLSEAGAGENGENNRVQLILRVGCGYQGLVLCSIAKVIQQEVKTYGKISGSSRRDEGHILFSLAVVGELRHPERFLKAVAQKVGKALERAEDQEYEAWCDDTW